MHLYFEPLLGVRNVWFYHFCKRRVELSTHNTDDNLDFTQSYNYGYKVSRLLIQTEMTELNFPKKILIHELNKILAGQTKDTKLVVDIISLTFRSKDIPTKVVVYNHGQNILDFRENPWNFETTSDLVSSIKLLRMEEFQYRFEPW